jgi:hypothetical protein
VVCIIAIVADDDRSLREESQANPLSTDLTLLVKLVDRTACSVIAAGILRHAGLVGREAGKTLTVTENSEIYLVQSQHVAPLEFRSAARPHGIAVVG